MPVVGQFRRSRTLIDTSLGRRRDEITIYRKQRVADGSGGWTADTLITVCEAFAQVVEVSARERFETMQTQQEHTHKVIIHYRRDLKRDDIVVYKDYDLGERELRCDYIEQIDNRRTTVLWCTEITE